MADSIMDSVLGMVSPEMEQSLARRFGAAPASVHTGLAAASAAILDGLASKADDHGFPAQVLQCVRAAVGQNVESDLSAIASAGPTGAMAHVVNGFLPLVFGSQQNQVAHAVAQQCGLSGASGVGLLTVAAPLLLAFFGKVQSAAPLDERSLSGMLHAAAPQLRTYLPSALLGSAAGVARAAPAGLRRRDDTADLPAPPRWLVPTAIAGALLLGWLAIRSFTAPKGPAAAATVTAEATNGAVSAASKAASEAATAAWAALGDLMKVKLPDGSVLSVPALGVEARLVNFLNDRSIPVSDSSWFDFDRLLFDTGRATLQSASQEQLTNIAAILKAYPQVHVRIAGYTDNTGDPTANLRLSEERANNVMDELVKLGIDPVRMSARGYGQEHPLADNDTEEGRQKNRRISLRVTDKQAAA